MFYVLGEFFNVHFHDFLIEWNFSSVVSDDIFFFSGKNHLLDISMESRKAYHIWEISTNFSIFLVWYVEKTISRTSNPEYVSMELNPGGWNEIHLAPTTTYHGLFFQRKNHLPNIPKESRKSYHIQEISTNFTTSVVW